MGAFHQNLMVIGSEPGAVRPKCVRPAYLGDINGVVLVYPQVPATGSATSNPETPITTVQLSNAATNSG